MSPQFTIGISIYKQPIDWIMDSIESVLDQSFSDWFLKIRLDGLDALSEQDLQFLEWELNDLNHHKIELICGQNRLGTFSSYKQIFEGCQSQYLLQLDADDYLEDTALYHMHKALEQEKDCPFAYTLCNSVDLEGKLIGLDSRALNPWSTNKDLTQFISFHGRAIRTEYYNKVGGYSSKFRFAGDYDLSLKLADNGDPVFIAIPLYNYRTYNSSTSQSNRRSTHAEAVAASRNALIRRGLSGKLDHIQHPEREVVSLHEKYNSPIIVAGMYCSGTSLLALYLKNIGIDLGNQFVDLDQDNQAGYFEDVDIVNIHDSWYGDYLECESSQLGAQWLAGGISMRRKIPFLGRCEWKPDADQYIMKRMQYLRSASQQAQWGWKDPRSTLILGFWQSHFNQIRVLCAYRAPWDDSDSLLMDQHVQDFGEYQELILPSWLEYNQSILDFYEAHPECTILVNGETLKKSSSALGKILSDRWQLASSASAVLSFGKQIIGDRLEYSAPSDSLLLSLYKAVYPFEFEQFIALDAISDLPSHYRVSPTSSAHDVCFGKEQISDVLICMIPVIDPSHQLLQTIASCFDYAPSDLRIKVVVIDVGTKRAESLMILSRLLDFGIPVVGHSSFRKYSALEQCILEIYPELSALNLLGVFLRQNQRLRSDFFESVFREVKDSGAMLSVGNCQLLDRTGTIVQARESLSGLAGEAYLCPCVRFDFLGKCFPDGMDVFNIDTLIRQLVSDLSLVTIVPGITHSCPPIV